MILFVVIFVAVYWYLTSGSGGSDSNSPSSGPVGAVEGWLQTMGQAMARFENSNPNYNNPMALQGSGDTNSTAGNGLGIYSTIEAGWQAGFNLLASYAARFPDLTITQALSRWAFNQTDTSQLTPDQLASLNNESGMVGSALGVDPNSTTLGDLSGSDSSDP